MRTTSAAVLFLAGLCLRSGTADCADRPRRPAPTVSAAMSPTEIRTVLTFDDQVLKVAAELGLDPAPQVVYAPQAPRLPFPVDRSKVAFVYPGYNAIVLSDRAHRTEGLAAPVRREARGPTHSRSNHATTLSWPR